MAGTRDITDNVGWSCALKLGLVDVKISAARVGFAGAAFVGVMEGASKQAPTTRRRPA